MNDTPVSIMVTGGAGFIGSHVVEALLVNPKIQNVIVVDNFFLGKEENLGNSRLNPKLSAVYRLDASNLQAMRDVVAAHRIDVVIDMAVVPLPTSLTFPHLTVYNNVGVSLAFAELLRTANIRKLVHISSSEAYGSAQYIPMDEEHPLHAITPYAASKSAGDQIIQSYVRTFGVDATIIRPFNNYGPRQNAGSYAGVIPIVIGRVESGMPIEVHGDGLQTRDFSFVKDTAKGIVDLTLAQTEPGNVYNLATGVEITILSLIEMILEVMGAPGHPIIHVGERAGDVRRHCAGIQVSKNLLGYALPSITQSQIAETVEWYLNR